MRSSEPHNLLASGTDKMHGRARRLMRKQRFDRSSVRTEQLAYRSRYRLHSGGHLLVADDVNVGAEPVEHEIPDVSYRRPEPPRLRQVRGGVEREVVEGILRTAPRVKLLKTIPHDDQLRVGLLHEDGDGLAVGVLAVLHENAVGEVAVRVDYGERVDERIVRATAAGSANTSRFLNLNTVHPRPLSTAVLR